jgi:hypothetical protein
VAPEHGRYIGARLAIDPQLPSDRRDCQFLPMKIKIMTTSPSLTTAPLLPFPAERDGMSDSPPVPRARPGDGRHDQLGNFQTALLGRITPASTPCRRSRPTGLPNEFHPYASFTCVLSWRPKTSSLRLGCLQRQRLRACTSEVLLLQLHFPFS